MKHGITFCTNESCPLDCLRKEHPKGGVHSFAHFEYEATTSSTAETLFKACGMQGTLWSCKYFLSK